MKVTAVIVRHKTDPPESKLNFPGLPPAPSRIGLIFEIRAQKVTFCCEAMEEAWGKRVIAFGEYNSMCNTNADVNLYEWHLYPEGSFADPVSIRFCPFCGSRVDVLLVEEEAVERSV